jgi:hypothetical protein
VGGARPLTEREKLLERLLEQGLKQIGLEGMMAHDGGSAEVYGGGDRGNGSVQGWEAAAREAGAGGEEGEEGEEGEKGGVPASFYEELRIVEQKFDDHHEHLKHLVQQRGDQSLMEPIVVHTTRWGTSSPAVLSTGAAAGHITQSPAVLSTGAAAGHITASDHHYAHSPLGIAPSPLDGLSSRGGASSPLAGAVSALRSEPSVQHESIANGDTGCHSSSATISDIRTGITSSTTITSRPVTSFSTRLVATYRARLQAAAEACIETVSLSLNNSIQNGSACGARLESGNPA